MLDRLFKILKASCLVLLGVALLVLFSGLILSNQQVVTVAIWGWITGPVELSTALFLAFLGGAVVAVTFGLLVLVRLLLRSRRLEKKLALSEKELQKLRVSALRGLAS
ncbi:Lipopolysaccharide assembly protein A domain-containing protein [Parendozoicomonas haliclonae]|uniref:Lipopolysaccharide assembly protein A domain-containing protein n=1 Tax=Parendozoicomonas haliclonae TaxID=1960125 RepID=A0A1X7AHG3_9GAMM|nr:hypothetical protein EHSB41UT_01264 [Parendozoicomonas haliclonae]